MTPGFIFLSLLLAVLVIWVVGYKRSPIIRETAALHEVTAIGVLFAVFMAAAMLSPINIGIWHLSVPITALVVLIGLVMPISNQLNNKRRLGVTACVVFSTVGCIQSAASAFPNYIAYFNDLTLGKPPYTHALDSNLDWGRD